MAAVLHIPRVRLPGGRRRQSQASCRRAAWQSRCSTLAETCPLWCLWSSDKAAEPLKPSYCAQLFLEWPQQRQTTDKRSARTSDWITAGYFLAGDCCFERSQLLQVETYLKSNPADGAGMMICWPKILKTPSFSRQPSAEQNFLITKFQETQP